MWPIQFILVVMALPNELLSSSPLGNRHHTFAQDNPSGPDEEPIPLEYPKRYMLVQLETSVRAKPRSMTRSFDALKPVIKTSQIEARGSPVEGYLFDDFTGSAKCMTEDQKECRLPFEFGTGKIGTGTKMIFSKCTTLWSDDDGKPWCYVRGGGYGTCQTSCPSMHMTPAMFETQKSQLALLSRIRDDGEKTNRRKKSYCKDRSNKGRCTTECQRLTGCIKNCKRCKKNCKRVLGCKRKRRWNKRRG